MPKQRLLLSVLGFSFLVFSITLLKSYDWKKWGFVRQIPFSSQRWKSAEKIGHGYTVRSQMIESLLKHYELSGKPWNEVVKVLGEPDHKNMDGWHYAYRIGRERNGPFSLDDEYLYFRLDSAERVCAYLKTVH